MKTNVASKPPGLPFAQPLRITANFHRFILVVAILALAAPVSVRADYTAVVNPASVVATNFEGWGTSLCWWANVVGGYSNRDSYMNLAFTQLKLNIVRYNIGGGENPSGDFITDYRAIMQGFEPSPGVWDWNADQNQRWVLRQAVALGADQVVAFANSPPWWMTVSGSVTGNGPSGGATDNLQTGYEDTFAAYLATVISNLTVLDGVHFDYVTPMNEPEANYWYYGDPKQEGCHMDANQQARVVNDLRAELNAQGLTNIGIDAPEDVSVFSSVSDLQTYGSTVSNVALLATHTYIAKRPGYYLNGVATALGRPAWVSEYSDGDATGMTMARRIHDDITGVGARAWIYWQVVDNAAGWGFLYNPLTANSATNYTINEKFYVMGQFSEFIRPGCDIISAGDTNTLAAWNPTNQTLTLVIVNTSTTGFNVTYNLGAFTSLPLQAAVYQTDNFGERLATLPALPIAGQMLTSFIPEQSVTTFVLNNVTLAPEILSPSVNAATNSVALYPGANPTFAISAAGSGPLGYQWWSNGVPVGGATTAAYSPPVGGPGSVADYSCVLTNLAGSVTSSVWSVSVLPPPLASYPRAVLPLHPVGYWRLNESPDNGSGDQGAVCHDFAGGNNGVYSNVVLGLSGYNQVTDPAGTSVNFGSVLPTNSLAGQIGNIDFSAPPGGNAEFSILAWVKGNAQTVDAGIVAKGYNGGGQQQFDLDTGNNTAPTVHGFRFFVCDAFGVQHLASSPVMPDGNWHQLAAVCDEANGLVHLYVDGVDSGDGSIPPGTALVADSSGDLSDLSASLISIGSQSGGNASPGFTNQFVGRIDEVAIFNYALNSNQVAALFAAASVPALNMAHSGKNAVITYTGTLLSSTNVAGPYTPVPGAASPYAVAPGGERFYRTSNP